jgi:hypothetical protein
VQYLSPFGELPAQQQALNQLQEKQAAQSARALQSMEARLAADKDMQLALMQQVAQSNALLTKLTNRNWLQRLVG